MEVSVFKIECTSGCYLEEKAHKLCEIDTTYSLDELCDFILESFGFDNDHMHQFFVSRTIRNNGNTIDDESIAIAGVFPLDKGHSLFMRFDFGDDWVFKISRSRKKAAEQKKVTYPRIIEVTGKNPEQYPMCEDY